MSSQWWIRDRGRIMGPFEHNDIVEMLAKNQVYGFNECSPDRITWQPLTEALDFPQPERKKPANHSIDDSINAENTHSFERSGQTAGSKITQFQIIVASTTLLIVAGLIGTICLLYFQEAGPNHSGKSNPPGSRPSVPAPLLDNNPITKINEDIDEVEKSISVLERQLSNLNTALRISELAARDAYEKSQRAEPGSANAIALDVAYGLAKRAVDECIANKNKVESDLRYNRDHLNQLKRERDNRSR